MQSTWDGFGTDEVVFWVQKPTNSQDIMGGIAMKDWMDFDGDGEVDGVDMMFAEEMLCSSKEEHEALFGDAGDFDDTENDFEDEVIAAGLDFDELEFMDSDERTELLEEAGLDPEDYDY